MRDVRRGRTPSRRSVHVALALVAAVLTATASAAPPPAPFPKQRGGRGHEETAGTGLFADAPYRARSAIIRWDGHIKSLDLYLFRRRVDSCSGFKRAATEPGRLLQIAIARQAIRLPLLVPMRDALAEFVAHRRTPPPSIVPVRRAVLIFTRIDTTRGASWRGRIEVKRSRIEGRTYAYSGTFAARWCVAR
jgi:hypothetical protein